MPALALPLNRPALHIAVEPGGEVVLKGSFTSTHDGSVLDAATTTWPSGAPGGESVDAGGLVDFEAGGLHMTSRDPVSHEVHAVATGDGNTSCSALGAQAPCLVLRVAPAARSRLLTGSDFAATLKGGLSYEIVGAPVYAPAEAAAGRNASTLVGVAAVAAVVGALVLVFRARRRRAASPVGQLIALARRVEAKLANADPVAGAALAPALAAVKKTLAARRVDPTEPEGKRVADVLRRLEKQLGEKAVRAKADEDRRVADELIHEMEAAIEAADEADVEGRLKRGPTPD